MNVFLFDASKGLVAGFEYTLRARVHTYTTDYYSLINIWSAAGTFYSSDLPATVLSTSFVYTGLSKTDVTLNWALLSSDSAKGYSTTLPVYTL